MLFLNLHIDFVTAIASHVHGRRAHPYYSHASLRPNPHLLRALSCTQAVASPPAHSHEMKIFLLFFFLISKQNVCLNVVKLNGIHSVPLAMAFESHQSWSIAGIAIHHEAGPVRTRIAA